MGLSWHTLIAHVLSLQKNRDVPSWTSPSKHAHNFFLEYKEETLRKHFYFLQWRWTKFWGMKAISSGSHLLITTFSCITVRKILKFTVLNLLYSLFETQGRPRCCAHPGRRQLVTKRRTWCVSSQFTIQGLQTAGLGCSVGGVAKEGCGIALFQIFMCLDWALCRSKAGSLSCPWRGELQPCQQVTGDRLQQKPDWKFPEKNKVSGNIMDLTWGAE